MINNLTLERDGFLLDIKIVGQGQDVIVLGSSAYYIKTFSSNLYQNLRFIFVDHRGFGKALRSFDSSAIGLDQIVEDLEFVRNYLSLDKFTLIGHSGHGYMALAYAQKYAMRLNGLILMNLSPYGGPRNFEAANVYFQESVCPVRKAILNQNMQGLPARLSANPDRAFVERMLAFGPMIWFDPAYDASLLWQDVNLVPAILEHLWGKIFTEIDVASYLQNLSVPVLLLLGRYDYWNPPYLWENYRALFSNLTVRVFEQSGHTPQLEEPNSFENEILAWLNSEKIKG